MALYRNGHRVDTLSNTSKIGCLLLSIGFIVFGVIIFLVFINSLKNFDFTSVILLLMTFLLISSGITYFKEFLDRK